MMPDDVFLYIVIKLKIVTIWWKRMTTFVKIDKCYFCAFEQVLTVSADIVRVDAAEKEKIFFWKSFSVSSCLCKALGLWGWSSDKEAWSYCQLHWSLGPFSHTQTHSCRKTTTQTLCQESSCPTNHQATLATLTPCGHYLTLLGNIHTHKHRHTVALTRTDASCHAFTERPALPSFSCTK